MFYGKLIVLKKVGGKKAREEFYSYAYPHVRYHVFSALSVKGKKFHSLCGAVAFEGYEGIGNYEVRPGVFLQVRKSEGDMGVSLCKRCGAAKMKIEVADALAGSGAGQGL